MNTNTLTDFTEHKRAICRFLTDHTTPGGALGPPRIVQITEATYLDNVRKVLGEKNRNKVVFTGKKDGTDRAWLVGSDGLFHLRHEPHSLLVPDTAIRMWTSGVGGGGDVAIVTPLSAAAMAQDRARAAGKNSAMQWRYDASGSLIGAEIGGEFVPVDAL